MDNRPRERQKNVTGSASVKKGQSTGNRPVGGGSGSGKKAAAAGGGVSIIAIIIAIIMNMSGGITDNGGSGISDIVSNISSGVEAGNSGKVLAKGESMTIANVSDRISSNDNGVKASTVVATGSRAKRTNILGSNKDVITFMVYMCGTDLESKSGMASSDLQEMAAASLSDNINIIVYTGGCNGWKIGGISSRVNQIFRIQNGKLICLEDDMGSKAMTDPENLASFIKYCAQNYPANRNELIMWDHGGGSVSGYGYDEKNKNSGSMSLSGINMALKNAGVTFDFVGFDACLMATAETALMLEPYADYLVASEETEPGIGWYYTGWLNALSKNTSMPTVELGKLIVDDFVATCGAKCRGQKTTLSVIDLAEFSNTVPDKLSAFSGSISNMLTQKDYKAVSNARNNTREFAESSKIDQVDLVNLATNMGTSAGKELAAALKDAVKYNRTSSNMTDAYGVSIYFPYKRTGYVDKACANYDAIGMDSDYAKCIKQVASLETSGQISTSSNAGSVSLLGSLLGLDRNLPEVDDSQDYMNESVLSDADKEAMIKENTFDISNLKWNKDGESFVISMSEEQWSLIYLVDKGMYFDDGTGYIDLGYDNVYSWVDGAMVADTEDTWLAINGQVVPYYHTGTIEQGDNYSINGYVPALLNGNSVKLSIVFDNDNPNGYIAGYSFSYKSETDTVAKIDGQLSSGDELKFVCDYYSYEGEYKESYQLGNTIKVTENMVVSDVELEDAKTKIVYRFTDLFDQEYFTEVVE